MSQLLLVNPFKKKRKKSIKRSKKMARRKTARRPTRRRRRRTTARRSYRRNPVSMKPANILKDIIPAVAGAVLTFAGSKMLKIEKIEGKIALGAGIALLGYGVTRNIIGSKAAAFFSVGAGTIAGTMALNEVLKGTEFSFMGDVTDALPNPNERIKMLPPLDAYDEIVPREDVSGYDEVSAYDEMAGIEDDLL